MSVHLLVTNQLYQSQINPSSSLQQNENEGAE